MNNPKINTVLIITCLVLLCLYPVYPSRGLDSQEFLIPQIKESKHQPSSPGPYPGNTLTQIGIERGPYGQIGSKLVELDPMGNIVWNYTYSPSEGVPSTLFDSELLSNGHILLIVNFVEDLPQYWGDNLHAKVLEITREGTIIWEYDMFWEFFDSHEIHDIDKLANGNILIADMSQDRVIEINLEGDLVWEWRAIDWLTPPINWDPKVTNYEPSIDPEVKYNDWTHLNDVDRLPNGNTLISLRNLSKVIEVNKTGNIVWSWGNYSVLGHPHNPDKLRNGNVLICDSGYNRVIEVNTTTQKIEWVYEGMLNWPRDADRLPNGNTLITDSLNDRIIEINPDKEIIWERTDLKRVYEADRLSIAPPPIIISPLNNSYSTKFAIDVEINSSDQDLDSLWYRIHDDLTGIWLDPTNITWESSVQRTLPPSNYTLYAYANNSAYWWQGDDSPSLTTMTSISFSIIEQDLKISGVGIQNQWNSIVQLEQGQYVPVHVNITNQGSVKETAVVSVVIESSNYTIGSVSLGIDPNTSHIITFYWNISEIQVGSYILSVHTNILPDEVKITDNSAVIEIVISPPITTITTVSEWSDITSLTCITMIGVLSLCIFARVRGTTRLKRKID